MSESAIRYYLVGGAVRDLLLGCLPREYDYAFSGTTELFLQVNPQACKVGQSVHVYLLDGQEFMPLHGGCVKTDLLCRDLTLNAFALEESGALHAHPQALSDLKSKVLRAASEHAFSDDPLRIFRLARFAARFKKFSLDPQTVELARAVSKEELARLPAERVCREVIKALNCPSPGRFLEVLHSCNAMKPWFIELEGADAVAAGPAPYHKHSVLGHTVEVMQKCAGDPLAVWMALCHDLGKMRTDPHNWPHHYGHERLGEDAALALAERLGMPTRYRDAGVMAARHHMKGGMYASLRLGTRCDLLTEMHKKGLHNPFWKLAEADSNKALRSSADTDLQRVLAVSLPQKWRNLGAESGRYLRELRCHALARGKQEDEAKGREMN